jgi:hypothetical protein
MKIAVTSSAFAVVLRRGDLTQLEWLEACANRLELDGVVFALADFPRTDLEYAAQIKKVTTDLGLATVALDAPGLLDPGLPEAARSDALTLATAIGSAVIRVTAGPPGDLPPETFARAVAATKAFTSAAKAANVTLAVAPAAGSLLADAAAVQNFCKYVDSAWLRFDRPPIRRVALDADPATLGPLPRRGWLVLEGDGGEDPLARVSIVAAALRTLESLGQRPQMPSVVPG